MHIKTLTIPLAILAALAIPTVAAAHNATASGTCQGGVTWNAFNFDKTVVNSITVTIDGIVRHQDPDFKASDAGTIATDMTVKHTWSVTINAPGTQYDKALSGAYGACVEVAPTTTNSATTIPNSTTIPPDPTTTAPNTASTVQDSTTTTSIVDIGTPPVPTTVALDVVALTPAEPVLPRTGLDGGVIGIALLLVVVGTFLVLRVRRET